MPGVLNLLPMLKLPDIYDEPFGDPSALPTYLVAQLDHAEVKVVLSADGADEMFGGYAYYAGMPERYVMMQRLPYGLRKALAPVLSYLPFSTLCSLIATITSLDSSKLTRYVSQLRELLPECTMQQLFCASNSYWFTKEVDCLLGAYQDPHKQGMDCPGALQNR